MQDQRQQLDPVESLWRALDEAERGGVFGRTPVSLETAGSVADSPGATEPTLPVWVLHLRRHWVRIAAMLALVVSVWGFLLVRELNHIRKDRAPAIASVTQPGDTLGDRFALRCLSGPGGSIVEGCRSFDLDTDGQVTLADYGALQRAPRPHRTQ